MQPECDQRFPQFPQEVLEESTDHMDVGHFTQHQGSLSLKETFSELLHWTLTSRDSVQSSLKTREELETNQILNFCESAAKLSPYQTTVRSPLIKEARFYQNTHLVQAPPLDLSHTVSDQARDSWMSHWSKPLQRVLKKNHSNGFTFTLDRIDISQTTEPLCFLHFSENFSD